MGLKKLGQDVVFTVDGYTSSYIRSVSKNPNTGEVDTTGLADAQSGYGTSQQGLKRLTFTFELMHPAAGESDDAYDAIMAAAAADGTVDVVHGSDTWNNMSVIEGETTNDIDSVMMTNIELRLTEAPGS